MQGIEKDGASGFAKGVGKGFVGLFTKPVVGVVDFLSHSTEGIRNTTTVFDQGELDKVRNPRFIAADGVIRVRPLFMAHEMALLSARRLTYSPSLPARHWDRSGCATSTAASSRAKRTSRTSTCRATTQ